MGEHHGQSPSLATSPNKSGRRRHQATMPGTIIDPSTKQREALFTEPLLSPGAKKRREGSYDRAEPGQARTLGEDYRA